MHKSKLVGLLKTFSSEDWKRFEEYLASPFFNKRESCLPLLQQIKKSAPEFEPEKCDRYQIWENAFPGNYANDAEIAAEMNVITQHAESFLGLQSYLDDSELKHLHVLDALETRKLGKNYNLQLKRLNKLLDEKEVRNDAHYLLRYQVSGVEVRESLQSKVRTYDANLQQTVEYLDNFYLVARLRITCELLNRQFILSGSYNAQMASELMAYLRNYDHDRIPVLAAYNIVLRLLTAEGGMEDYQKLANLISHESTAFDRSEWQDLFSYAQNFCIRKVRAGESSYLKELFSLYQLALNTGDMLENGEISPWKYKNIASVGLRLEEYEWVKHFIEDYKERLPLDFQENAYAYNLADLHYRTGAYDLALKKLLWVEFTDVFYSIDTRKMMLMIYFEQGETEAMRALIASFRVFLKRNKLISEGNRIAYSNFVNLVQEIFKRSGQKKQSEALLNLISTTQPLVEEEWLREMAQKGYQEEI